MQKSENSQNDECERKLLSKKIFKAIKEIRYTQEKFAEYMGVSTRTISNWVSGESVPDMIQMQKIANLTNYKLEYFCGIENNAEIEKKREGFREIEKNVTELMRIIESLRDQNNKQLEIINGLTQALQKALSESHNTTNALNREGKQGHDTRSRTGTHDSERVPP